MNNDSEMRIRMAAAVIEETLKKADLQMVVVEVLVDGKSMMRSIQILDRQPVTGVAVQFAQGVAILNG